MVPLLLEFLAERPTPTTRQVSSGGPPPQLLRDPGSIDGEIVKASDSATLPSINPVTERAIGEVPDATPEDVDRAVRSARHASTKWTETSSTTSAQILNHDMLSDHVDELSVLDAGAPFGGFKTSGIGKEKGRTAMERKSAPPCVPAINRRQMIAGTVAALAMPAILASRGRPARQATSLSSVL